MKILHFLKILFATWALILSLVMVWTLIPNRSLINAAMVAIGDNVIKNADFQTDEDRVDGFKKSLSVRKSSGFLSKCF